jgi:hypothetical protein
MNIETIQLPKLMGEPFPKLMFITLQQGVSWEPMWEPIKNPTFWYHEGMLHYNNRGLFCDPNIIANNKERSFQKPAVANHNSSQTLKLLRYHNICTRTIASPLQLRNLIQSQNFSIVTASIHCLRLTLHQKLFATHPSSQRLSESTQKSIGF